MHALRLGGICAAFLLATPAVAQSSRLELVAAAILEAHTPAADDPDAIATRLLTAARGAAASPAASLAVGLASRHAPRARDPHEILRLLDELLASTPHGLAAHEARVLQFRLLRELGRHDDASAIDPWRGFASHFTVVGPFGGEGDTWAGVLFAPELGFPRADEVLAGRFGAVTPRVVRREPHAPAVRLRRDDHDDESGCFYALHQVRAPAATACYVEIGCDGSFELFVNDEHRARVIRERSRQSDRHRVPVRLVEGINHVLVKTTDARHDAITLRYLDAKGDPVELVELTSREPLPRADGERPPLLGTFVDGCRVLESAAASDEGGARFALAAMLACFDQGETDRALEILARFDEAAPSEPELQLALVAALDRATALPPEVRRARVQTLVGGLAEAFADHHFADLRRARLMIDEDRREDAVRLLQDRLARHPHEAETYDLLHVALRELRFEAEATRVALRWRENVPHDPRPALVLARDRARGGDPGGALALIEATLERRPGASSLQRSALALAVDLGRTELRDRMLDALHADRPDSVAALRMRAEALHDSGDDAGGLDADERLAAHPEAGASTIVAAARRLAAGGRQGAALAAYRSALAIDPSLHATRRLLRHLDGEHEEFPWLARFRSSGDAAIERFEATERELSASSTLVLDQMIVRFYPDGSAVAEAHTVRRINDLRGVEAYSDADDAARADEVVAIRTLATDGKSYVPNRVQGAYAMPRLEPGAFVELITRDFRRAPGEAPWRASPFWFRSPSEPYLLSELVVILPPNHPGSFRVRRFDGETEVVELPDGYRAHVFRKTDVPRLETEALTPPVQDLVPVVAYGEDRDLGAQARAAWSRAEVTARSSPWVAATARAVVDGIDGDTARARALYDHVHTAIAGGRGPADPTAILLRGQGPRFFLWVAMLGEAGIPFRHAMSRAAAEPLVEAPMPLFLGDEEYQVPAVHVEPRDGPGFWVFADNARYQPIGTVPPERFGAAALLLATGQHDIVRVAGHGERTEELGWALRGELALRADGGADFDLEVETRGDTGYSLTDRMRDLPEAHRSVVARQLAAQFAPGWTVADSSLGSLDPGARLAARARLGRAAALVSAGEDLLLPPPVPPLDLVSRLAELNERRLPLRIAELRADDTVVRIEPGDAYRVAGIPDGIEIHSALLDFSLAYRRGDDGSVTMTRHMVLRPGTVAPADYGGWQRMLRAIDSAEQAKIRLRPR